MKARVAAVCIAAACVQACLTASESPGGADDAVVVEDGVWTFAPTEGATCGDGSTTGFGLNSVGASDLLVYLQGGGACTSAETCFGPFAKAVQIETGYDAVRFAGETNLFGLDWLSRVSSTSPFVDMDMAFIPYCTGDLHAGAKTTTYGELTVHHTGAENVARALSRLRATRPDVERVFLAGASGGAFGAWFAIDAARAAFPDAEVHIAADSGPPVDVDEELAELYEDVWALRYPESCATCRDEQSSIVSAIAESSPTTRVALLTYESDPLLADYLSIEVSDFDARLMHVLDEIDAHGQRAFVVSGQGHVVISNPLASVAGVSLAEFLRGFVDGDESPGVVRD